ncbi:MAG: BamA/TamA family outer membrane protein [Proteobacteria bacterium]|uniref:BamA/TamA family outer membrane protein n=1 Tax=Aquabacterium sp. TaxID=1872578 RepID=UPI0035C67D9E|nr:BamA/TamA family outer membrane protein [Pseudomonadota bacterium]
MSASRLARALRAWLPGLLVGMAMAWAADAPMAQTVPVPVPAPAPASPVGVSASASAASLPAAGPASAPGEARVPRKPPKWRLVVDAPAPLDRLLEDNLDLARFQKDAAVSRGELRRLVAAVPQQARSLLDAQGHFAAEVRTRVQEGPREPGRRDAGSAARAGVNAVVAAVVKAVVGGEAPQPAQAAGDVRESATGAATESTTDAAAGAATEASTEGAADAEVLITVSVEPGPLTRVRRVQFVFEGELDQRLSAADPVAQALADQLAQTWALSEGEPFRQAAWASAKTDTLARLRADTYPLASWSGTSATVDATEHTASLYLVADSGPAFAFGPIRVEGLKRQPASAIVNLAPFKPGGPYRERQLLDWQERIQKLGLFESVFVSPTLDAQQPKDTPLVVQVREMPLQSATAGIGVSSDNGPRVSLEHLHRNAFGLDWQAKTRVQLGARLKDAQLDVTSHPWEGRKRGLISLQTTGLIDSDNAITNSQRARMGLLREGERLERSDYLELQHASVRSANDLLVSNATALSATTQWIFRDVDNRLLPTRGTTSMAQLTFGRTYSALEEDGFFGRAHTRVTAYLPLPWTWQLTARGEVGQVLARESVSVPDTLLFRAGGDDSVRGYAYRSLGVEIDGVTTGARAVATGSVELAHPLPVGVPGLQGAIFADVGDAADRFSKMSAKRGHGLGVRWRSPVGPFRLDVAYGDAVQKWRLHFSVGISL